MINYVICKICKKQLKRIGNWHLKTHNMSISNYKQIYGNDNMISETTKYNLGKPFRNKKRPNHSLRMSGKNNPAYGGRSKETCEKISKNRKGKGIGISGKYIRTNEIKKKISDGVAKYIISGKMKNSNSYFKNGYYYSDKMRKKQYYRSSWELFVMEYLDKHPLVIYWEYEPMSIKYTDDNGNYHNYIPDFYVKYDCGIQEIWEVKPKYKLDNFKNKIIAFNKFLSNNDKNIRNGFLITENEIQMMKTFDPEKYREEHCL